MHRETGRRHALTHRAQHLFCLARRADADRVAERDFVAAEIRQRLRDIGDRLRLHFAVIGTAKHAGDVAADLDAIGLGVRQHRPEPLDRFRNRAIDVGA